MLLVGGGDVVEGYGGGVVVVFGGIGWFRGDFGEDDYALLLVLPIDEAQLLQLTTVVTHIDDISLEPLR